VNPLDHALDYAARGLPVFPCNPTPTKPKAKTPLTPHGFKDATTNPNQIRAWWQQWPTALIGGAMGSASGLFAVDPDVPKEPGDADGLAAWNALAEQHGGIPPTHSHETPSGGRHVLFAYPEGLRITNKEGALKGTGINVRGDGGYVIMAPSQMADGRVYRVADEFDFWQFAPAPGWLLDMITAEPEKTEEPRPDPEQKSEDRGRRTGSAIERYVAAAVEKECEIVARCGRGGRNNQLNISAFNLGTLVGANVLGSAEAVRRLYAAAGASGLVKSDGKASVDATIESGLTDGAAKPRDMSKIGDRSRQSGSAKQSPRSDDAEPGRGDNVGLVTEDEGAILFAERHQGQLRFCHDHGAWFEWTGSIWKRNGTARAFHFARELARQMAESQDRKTEVTARKASFAGAVERFARADPVFAVTAETWDRDPWLLGTPGGTVDLRTGLLRLAKPEDGITKTTARTPTDTAQCPLWLKFLAEATNHDVEMVRFLQLWAGYSLTGDTREHALVFVFGPGGNGKSVAVNVQVGIMGDYATTAAMDVFIASSGDKHPTDLAMLRGARLVTASETEEGRQWAESRIKQLTGGDRITARFMRQDFFTFLPSFKLQIIGNHKPGLRNVDDAARRRFNLVPFIHTPAAPDRQLEEKLKAEWAGILRWAIDGCMAWQRDGLVRPASIKAATEAYFADQDTFGAWLEEDCEVEPGNRWKSETSANLFSAWSRYAKAANEAAMTRKAFSERMQRAGFEVHRGTGGVRSYQGIRLHPSARMEAHADAA